MANPFTVHLGLLYINEDCGPIIELLCAINIIPAITSTNPTTSNSLTKMGFLIPMIYIVINKDVIDWLKNHIRSTQIQED
jgi:hypothetical protein